ncbi:hypothetical protein ACP4OV_013846 [Aristida adscensionis]
MARHGTPNYPRGEPPAEEAAAVVRAGGDGRLQRVLHDGGRVLMLWGWGTLTAGAAASSSPSAAPAGNLLGLLLWLAGVSLVALAPVARRFPRAARLAAAVADAVIERALPPWN